jgi:hypothetical protein
MNQLVGTWRLVSFAEYQPDGAGALPYGPNPVGFLMYDASGRMSVQIMRSGRDPLPSMNFDDLDPELLKSTLEGFTAFSGTYHIDESAGIVIHKVECHILPNSVGKELKRSFELVGDKLFLKPSASRLLVWQRI